MSAGEIIQPGFYIAGTGRYLPNPENPVTNEEVVAKIRQVEGKETTSQRIVKLSHIETRHFAREFETTTYMGVQAANSALQRAGMSPEEIDLVIAASFTADRPVPPLSADIAGEIGAINAKFFDMNGACASFLLGTVVAHSMMRPELKVRNTMVVGVDRMSKILDMGDRNTAFLFGDYSGAVIYSATEDERGIIGISIAGDASRENRDALSSTDDSRHVAMPNGALVFKYAERSMVETTKEACEMAGIERKELGMYVLHQANGRIIDGVVRNSDVSESVMVPKIVNFAGNASSATLPFALDYQLEKTGHQPVEFLAMTAAGAGVEAGAIIMRNVIGKRS